MIQFRRLQPHWAGNEAQSGVNITLDRGYKIGIQFHKNT